MVREVPGALARLGSGAETVEESVGLVIKS